MYTNCDFKIIFKLENLFPFKKKHYSTVTKLPFSTPIPFLTFILSLKLDKKRNIIDNEYVEFDIVFIERN